VILSQPDTFLNLIIIVPTEAELFVIRTSPVTPVPALLGIEGNAWPPAL
jgi:hypothetical protein